MTESPFLPGVTVAVMERYGNVPDREAKIAKVYKNGNFVLVGSSQQYRCWGSEAGDWTGLSTEKGWRTTTVKLMTPELREQMLAAKRVAEFHWVACELGGVKGPISQDQFARLQALYGELKGEAK